MPFATYFGILNKRIGDVNVMLWIFLIIVVLIIVIIGVMTEKAKNSKSVTHEPPPKYAATSQIITPEELEKRKKEALERANEINVRLSNSSEDEDDVIHTKVVGVTFENRQELLKRCSEGYSITIRNAPISGHPHAMGVFTLLADPDWLPSDGVDNLTFEEVQLGYLRSELAETIYTELENMDSLDEELDGEITEITGGTEDRPNLGCNIEFEKIW
jgi:hypothetical protein